jgi:hypothetical protein
MAAEAAGGDGACGGRETALNIHHGWYARGCDPWAYDDDTLYCLCQPCHERAEAVKRDLYFEIGRIHPRDHESLLASVRAWVAAQLAAKLRRQAMEPPAPVVLVGVRDGQVTADGTGEQRFPSLESAREAFPDLDPAKPTERFTQAMPAISDDQTRSLRFETWIAYQLYSG